MKVTVPEFPCVVELLHYWCTEGREMFSTADRSPHCGPAVPTLAIAFIPVTANTADAGGSSTTLDNTAKWTELRAVSGPLGFPDE